MCTMYDVIIIGAGPAGCMAAKKTADAGYNVLLVEKMEVPREKSCSGLLIKKSIDMVENEFGPIPRTILCKNHVNKGIIITNEANQIFKFESEGLNLWRSSFDHWMTIGAQNAGAEFRPSTSAISCEEKQDHVLIKLQNNEIYYEKAKIVIACDGSNSNIKRKLLKSRNNVIFTYQTFCEGTVSLDYNFFHAFTDPLLSQYDAWFNVKDDLLILGVAVKETNKIKPYYSRFLSFLTSKFDAQIESFVKAELGMMPQVSSDYNIDLGKGRILFAGEAANFLNPIGEGISIALSSGFSAAEAIKSTYTRGTDVNTLSLLYAYKKHIEHDKQYMMRQWEFFTKIAPNFSQ